MTDALLSKIEVLYEDEDALVINKPAGLVVHFDGKTKEPSVSDWFIKKYPDSRNVGEPWQSALTTNNSQPTTILRPGIVHRLDRETSGALLIAKNQKAFEFLKEQFKSREVIKKYHAFVYGRMKEDEGSIIRSIGRSKKDFRMYSAQRGMRGKLREAETKYRVIKRSKDFSFVELIPKTGRTHQIRVHLKAINHPVVCDYLYAPKRECALGFERLALHALGLSFKNISGKMLEIETPYPDDFRKALESLDS